ncbi:Abi-alpha family protein [Lentilactobacillus senioris]|uniref:Abi-alpha family protein n=1 Tax=Lentilactobacillus senioris TaxID=931534 RepID=UPI00227E2A4E|nr:Abi-alpha family protein [Lentilactobacillus senioris]MCY9807485.1 Abi-alpha family protein [Lentilactobacillus senioris]
MDPNLIQAGLDSLPESTVEKILNPTAEVLGDSAGGLVRTIFYPLLHLNIFTKKKLEDYEQKIANNVKDIPEKYRDPSMLPIFLETLEKSKYKVGDDEIRSMFENILTKSLDSRYNSSISPRYANVVSQLSPKDASYLQLMNKERTTFNTILNAKLSSLPVAKLIDLNNNSSDMTKPFLLVSDHIPRNLWLTIDNLEGLGIAKLDFNSYLHYNLATELYEEFKDFSGHPEFISSSDLKIATLKGVLKFTSFGQNLLDIIE